MSAPNVSASSVAGAAENGLELAVRQAAQLIVKTVGAQGFVNGAVLPGTTADDHPVDGASFVANGNARVLSPFARLTPMVGVCMHEGEQVLVIGPWMVPFDQLSLHGFLSVDEVQQLKAAAKKIERDLYRTIARKNAQAVAAREREQQEGHDSRATIAHRLEAERVRLGMTQKQLADACGKSLRTYQDWASGKSSPTADYLARMASGAGIDVAYVVTGVRA